MSDPRSSRGDAHLDRRLRAELEKSRSFFSDLSVEDWQAQVYTEGAQWTVRQVLTHLVASERALRTLIQAILQGGPGTPDDFDLTRFNESQVRKLEADPPADLVLAHVEERDATLSLMNATPIEDLAKRGTHPYFGEISVRQLFKWIYQHGRVHRHEVQQALHSASSR